ncbi:MAG: DoxX family protein [Saprospiraceae bacterium]|nr:DoxX family protein [Saprospiraceae bacterium]
MKWIAKINLVLLILLSFSTAIVKLMQMPAEMTLFRNAGFSDTLTMAFGVAQLLGAILLVPFKTRKSGALIMMLTFAIATAVVFINQMIPFGVFSILFIAMATWVYRQPVQILNEKV